MAKHKINLKYQKFCENKITNICCNVLINYAVTKKLSLHKSVSKVISNELSSTRKMIKHLLLDHY